MYFRSAEAAEEREDPLRLRREHADAGTGLNI